jgi:hypothetical protein
VRARAKIHPVEAGSHGTYADRGPDSSRNHCQLLELPEAPMPARSEGPLWIDGGPSFIVRESAAVGGFRTFPPRSGTRSFDLEESFAPTPGSNCLDRGAHSHLLPKDMVTGSRQLVEQGPRLFQIGRIEAFGEPAVDRGEKVAGFRAATLAAAEPSEAHGRA